jgi:hypothetical protein
VDGTEELMMPRVLLLVPARTYRATDFLVAASRMGLELVVGSDGALPLGGHPVVRVNPNDPQGSVARLVAESGPVDAVVAVDTPMLVLAAAGGGPRGGAPTPRGRQGHPTPPVGGRRRGPASVSDRARRRLGGCP